MGDIVGGVRAALDRVAAARSRLLAAMTGAEQAAAGYAEIGRGSARSDLDAAASHTQAAVETIRSGIAMLDSAASAARRWLALIAGPAAAPVDVERLRGELPPPITTAERGTGRKTHGRWIAPDGVARPVVSGHDEWSSYADSVFKRWDRRMYSVVAHAEMKIAARLRAEFERTGQPRHAIVVLNQEPCPGMRGCARLLPVMLPDGCSLTVHAPNYRRTFTGGMKL